MVTRCEHGTLHGAHVQRCASFRARSSFVGGSWTRPSVLCVRGALVSASVEQATCLGEQRVVGADLGDPAFVDDYDAVRVAERGRGGKGDGKGAGKVEGQVEGQVEGEGEEGGGGSGYRMVERRWAMTRVVRPTMTRSSAS